MSSMNRFELSGKIFNTKHIGKLTVFTLMASQYKGMDEEKKPIFENIFLNMKCFMQELTPGIYDGLIVKTRGGIEVQTYMKDEEKKTATVFVVKELAVTSTQYSDYKDCYEQALADGRFKPNFTDNAIPASPKPNSEYKIDYKDEVRVPTQTKPKPAPVRPVMPEINAREEVSEMDLDMYNDDEIPF